MSVAIAPGSVSTAVIRPSATLIPSRDALAHPHAVRGGGGGVALHDRLRAHVAVARAERGPTRSSTTSCGTMSAASAGVSTRDGTPSRCCTSSAARNARPAARR